MPQYSAGNNLRLGLFVVVGLASLMAMLFLLGRKQNLFSSSLQVQADFRNVSGLLTGNNVRLAGLPVGTVRRIQIVNDSTVRVVMDLNRDVQAFVKKNAVASIGTDGLVGNTIVNLSAVPEAAPPIQPGDQLRTTAPLAIDDMLKTLNVSNKNLVGITHDLRQVSHKLNGSSVLWDLLDDKQLAANVRRSMGAAASAAAQMQVAARDVQLLTRGVRQGRGPAGFLLTDTVFARQLHHTTRQLARSSDTLATTLSGLKQRVETNEGPLNTLLADTSMSRQLRQSIQNVEQGTAGFSRTMDALQHNFLVRGYIRRQNKRQAKQAEAQAQSTTLR